MTPKQREWQRATRPDQKAQREAEILAAAKRLFATTSYDQVSLNGIAREAKMSKPNIYRYFASREEIFLLLFAEERDRFMESLKGDLKRVGPALSEAEIARLWVGQALAHQDLLRLLPQLGTSLEENSSLEHLVPFKKTGFEKMAELAAHHHRLYPRLKTETWGEVLTAFVALMAGFWPLCSENHTVKQAMRHPDVNLEPWDFESKLTFALEALIKGAG